MLSFPRVLAILALSFPILSTGCANPLAPKRKSQAKPEIYFVKGNPEELLKDTLADTQSFFSLDSLAQFEDFGIRSYRVIQTQIPVEDQTQIQNQAELEAANSTGQPEKTVRGFDSYEFVQASGEYLYQTTSEGFKDYPVLRFTNQGGSLSLIGLNEFPLKPLHYSLAADKKSFSILASYRDSQVGLQLVAITFSRNPKSLPKRLLGGLNDYEYFLGTGIQASWRKPLKLSLCGIKDKKAATEITGALEAWSQATQSSAGMIGGLSYELDTIAEAKPFNDLNQNCINYVKNYRFENQERYVELGNATLLIDPETLEIIDAHVFLFADALQRAGLKSLAPTAIHELGHVLGLGHEFRRNPETGVTLHRSVMGYEGIDTITDWDRAALLELYPTNSNGNFSGLR